MVNIPNPIQATDQSTQPSANFSSTPTPQFIPESKPKTIIIRIFLFLKMIVWSGGILFFAFQYYTNFKLCQETGRITSSSYPLVSTSCAFLDQLIYPPLLALKMTFLLFTLGFMISLPLFILFVVFLLKSKDKKAYLLGKFFIINAVLFLLSISQMLSLIKINIWLFIFSWEFVIALLLLPIVILVIRVVHAIYKRERRPKRNYWFGIVCIFIVGLGPVFLAGMALECKAALISLMYIIVFCTLLVIAGFLGI